MNERGIKLTPEQESAIFTPGNLILRAGAGSGKTEVLARRFIALITGEVTGSPIIPAAIAAIAFNEKAALDIRLRIAQVLDARIAGAPASEVSHLIRSRRTLSLARISTIHAFCARILRENPLEADLDPDFQVLDEYESATLFDRVCRGSLIALIRAHHPGAEFLMKARGMRGIVRDGALKVIRRLFNQMAQAGQPADAAIELTTRTAFEIQMRARRVAQLAQQLVAITDDLLQKNPGNPRLRNLAKFWTTARDRVLRIDCSSSPEAFEVLRTFCGLMPDMRDPLKSHIEQIRSFVTDKSPGRFGLKGELIASWGEQRALGPARGMAGVLGVISTAFTEALKLESALTFDDLLIRTRDLLRDNPTVAARYRSELGALLVDEYQDTNGLQDEIVELLTAPGMDAAESVPQLFIVGDEKQSIYRFRGADVRVFRRARGAGPVELLLTENRRSTANILGFVNGLSASMMSTETTAQPDYWVAWSSAYELKAARAGTGSAIEVIAAVTDPQPDSEKKLKAGGKRGLEASAIASLIAEKIDASTPIFDPADNRERPVLYGDIAILFRAFSDIRIYEQALLDAAIPCYTVKGRGFYGRREVIDVIELLNAIDDPGDSLALAAALRSPLFGLSDECLLQIGLRLHDSTPTRPRLNSIAELFFAENPDFSWLSVERETAEQAWRILHELRVTRGRAQLPVVVERALELTDYETVMAGLPQGRQRIANLRKLVELARRFDARHFFTFHDFVAYLRQLVEEEPFEPQAQLTVEDENVVRLMTIHQAKGLEFPMVIVADVGRPTRKDSESIQFDPARGLILCDTCGSGHDEIPNAALAEYRKSEQDQDEAEARRIFYVAVTRARDHLILSEGAGTAGWGKMLREFIGEEDFKKRLENAKSGTIKITKNGVPIVLRRYDAILGPKATTHIASQRSEHTQHPAGHPISLRSKSIDRVGDLVISPTAIADFARCPRQYWLRHRLGLDEEREFQGRNASVTMGSVAHEVLERLDFESFDDATRERTVELTETIGTAAGLGSEARAQIARDLITFIGTDVEPGTIVGREMPFMLNPADNLFIRGQIDVVIRRGAVLTVRDYKYSAAAGVADYEVQMHCYALAVALRSPDSEIRAEIVALRDGSRIMPLALPHIDILRTRLAKLGSELESAHRERDYPKRPSNSTACRALGCGYIRRCWAPSNGHP